MRYWRLVEAHYTRNSEPKSEQLIIRMSFQPVRCMFGPNAVDQFTPLCSFKPDWAAVVEVRGQDRIHFAIKTEGSLFSGDLRAKEQ